MKKWSFIVLTIRPFEGGDWRGFVWGRDHFETVNSAKNSITTLTNKYHQSTGHYFSQGNRGNLGMVDNLSIGAQSCKSGDKGNMNSKFNEYMMNMEIHQKVGLNGYYLYNSS